jgi:hypothetical protein
VSATISQPVRIFALVGLLAATGLAAFVFLTGRQADPAAAQATPAPQAAVTPAAARAPQTVPSKTPAPARRAQAAPATRAAKPTRSGLPVAIDRLFRGNRIVVVAIYMPGAAVDAHVRAEARAGADRAKAGFVAIAATSERLVAPLVAKTGVLPEPAVVVLRRPGTVVTTLGVTDSGTVAQAVLHAKR